MAKKSAASETKNVDTVVIDETHEYDGGTVRLYVDLLNVKEEMELYSAALRDARNIPFDLENLPGNDPILRHLIQAHKNKIEDAAVLRKARAYYQNAVEEVNSNAILLSFFSHEDNVFTNEPQTYPETVVKTLPGIVPMPEIKKNLSDPVEYRLKQILDIMVKTPAIFGVVTEMSKSLAVRLTRLSEGYEVDKAGFRNGSTGGTVHEDDVPSGEVEEVQA